MIDLKIGMQRNKSLETYANEPSNHVDVWNGMLLQMDTCPDDHAKKDGTQATNMGSWIWNCRPLCAPEVHRGQHSQQPHQPQGGCEGAVGFAVLPSVPAAAWVSMWQVSYKQGTQDSKPCALEVLMLGSGA